MAKILCVSSELPGIVYANVELARRLQKAGHEVTFACEPDVAELAAAQTLAFCRLVPDRYREFLANEAGQSWSGRVRRVAERRRAAARATGAADFAEELRDLAPDLVVLDGELHERIIAARGAGVPIALSNTLTYPWRRPGVPPAHHIALPGRGFRGSRLGCAALWTALRLRKAWRRTRHRVTRAGADRLAVLGALARDAGIDLARETDRSEWLIPFTWRTLPVLHLRARELDFPHEPPPHVHYVGPMQLQGRSDRQLDPHERRVLDEVIARRARGGGKLVYAGFGAFFSTGGGLVQRLIAAAKAAGEVGDLQLLVSLGGRARPEELGELPANVHALTWVPQLEVLQHADLVVNHGGINTVDECITHGVPMVVYPGSATDMNGTASRVLFHRLGLLGDPRDDAAAIVGRWRTVLDEPEYRANVQRLRHDYARYIDDAVLERTVESLLLARARP